LEVFAAATCIVKDRATYSHEFGVSLVRALSAGIGFLGWSRYCFAQDVRICQGETDATVLDGEPLPVYAEDLPENVRGAFDLTCNFVLRYHNNLKAEMDQRFYDLGVRF
jgi:hypothetical protein